MRPPIVSMTRIVRLGSVKSSECSASSSGFEEIVADAVATLLGGGVVALPTDTLYGITALLPYTHRLYDIKKRSSMKPIGLFLGSPSDAALLAKVTIPDTLLHQLLPGPVTLIFDRLSTLPADFNPETEKVGIRVPLCPLVTRICAQLGGSPLAQTSANASGSLLNPTKVADFKELHQDIHLIIDAGDVSQRRAGDNSTKGSTIVDLSRSGYYRIVRSGCALESTMECLERAGLKHLKEEHNM